MMREGEDEEAPNKRYLALLVGKMPQGTMTVEAPLLRLVGTGGDRSVRVDPAGKPSTSHFKLLERRSGHSFCEVIIETGRTHQIRVHAAHIGHAVAGDDKYGEREANKRLAEQAGLKRLFLHAAAMSFDLGGKPYALNTRVADDCASADRRRKGRPICRSRTGRGLGGADESFRSGRRLMGRANDPTVSAARSGWWSSRCAM